jgi:hypothetical protein
MQEERETETDVAEKKARNKALFDAKKSLKHLRIFLKTLHDHLHFADKNFKNKAIITTFCIHEYVYSKLQADIIDVMLKHSGKPSEEIQ